MSALPHKGPSILHSTQKEGTPCLVSLVWKSSRDGCSIAVPSQARAALKLKLPWHPVTALPYVISSTQLGPYRNSSKGFTKPKGERPHLNLLLEKTTITTTPNKIPKKPNKQMIKKKSYLREARERDQKCTLQQINSMGNLWHTASLSIK